MRNMYLIIILTIMVLGVGCGNTDGTGVKDGGQQGSEQDSKDKKQAGPSGTGAGPSGTGAGPSGTGAGPSGTGAGPSGTGAGPSGTGAGPSGTGAGPSGTGAGPSGTGAGPSGTGAGPSGTGAGPSGTGAGPSGQAGAATCPDTSYTPISTAADLKAKLKDGNICLTANIELENWVSIEEFKGKLDGNDKTLTIKSFRSGAVGLIKEIAADGEVKDLSIELEVDLTSDKNNVYVGVLAGENKGRIDNVNVKMASGKKVETKGKDSRAGGLVGYNEGTITNSYATGAVTGTNHVGGLVGGNSRGTITNSYATGAVTGTNHAGGLVGGNSRGTITNSYATGAVTGTNHVGGLVGDNYNSGTIENSRAEGKVKASGDSSRAGGLVGVNYSGTITNSYATGAVEGEGDTDTGGLVGVNRGNGTITNSYATGDVSASESSSSRAGGLVGENGGTIENSYATGDVSGRYAGGLVGRHYSGTITNSYATGAVTGTNHVGGLVGDNEGGTITNSFVLSSALKPVGRGSDNGVEAIAKSAIKGTTFSAKGWSTTVWKNLVAGQWPKLSWQTQQ